MIAAFIGLALAAAPSPEALRGEWRQYVRAFVQDDGRVIDRGAADISTSEGQAYALARAVWCDDRGTFDRVLRWTSDNLQRGDAAKLPSWKWGKMPDGKWGVIDPAPAADADQWMAWALLEATDRWHEPAYAQRAGAMLARIWEEETLEIAGRRVVLPGSWARDGEPVQLNPSYWLPFAWRRFARLEPERGWLRLVDDAYVMWDRCASPSGLPPDWCWVNRATGARVDPPEGRADTSNFGFEAFRIGWTLAAEVRWHDEPRARRMLEPFGAFADRWVVSGPLPAVIAPDGAPRETWSYLGLYGALLPAWASVRPAIVDGLYVQEVRGRREAAVTPSTARDYYAHNWVWFGLALWTGLATP